MEIHYRSKSPCTYKPEIFTTGGYRLVIDGREFQFDFENMEANTKIVDGFLNIYSLQRNLDSSLFDGYTAEELDAALKQVRKEGFTEIFYECFADQGETESIHLEPVSITFYDDGNPITVEGEGFAGLEGKTKRTIEEYQEEFLDHLRLMVGYWDEIANGMSQRERLEGLAFSFLTALDGGANITPYFLAPIIDDDGTVGEDIAGCLHEMFHKR
jgi:hypothetical protein